MGHLTWLTDPHLDFLESDTLETFISRVAARRRVTASSSAEILRNLIRFCPFSNALIRFSRHPFILSWVIMITMGQTSTQCDMRSECGADTPAVRNGYRTSATSLSEQTALVGHSGWGDGGYGDFLASTVRLNDYLRSLISLEMTRRHD